ncbi:SEC-C metal-binding domain-containing protein [Zavarzinia sp. CC-PAN008]|uniref:SEC-C metal-binding domain-containing protein n=1 Tax=Zavarzinia sp. CC-PAN008 TaxID=3243332 RepID=UPI003F74A1DE
MSIFSKFKSEGLLNPRRLMGINDYCWCKSGKKWKSCHMNRENEKRVNFPKLYFQHESQFRRGYCAHPLSGPKSCSGPAISSHTIQKNGGIRAIAENGHVLSCKPQSSPFKEQSPLERSIEKIGVGRASTFPGFCSKHDNETFRYIEGDSFVADKRSMFLLSYRSLCYELYQKKVQLAFIPIHKIADKGMSFEVQEHIQQEVAAYEASINIGLAELQHYKNQADEILMKNRFDDIYGVYLEFSDILPVVASGASQVEYDFQGTMLQSLGYDDKILDHIILNITSFSGRSIAFLGWIGAQCSASRQFCDSFLSIDTTRVPDQLLRFSFDYFENTYIKESWWKALPPTPQKVLSWHRTSGIGERYPLSLCDDGTKWTSVTISNEVVFYPKGFAPRS